MFAAVLLVANAFVSRGNAGEIEVKVELTIERTLGTRSRPTSSPLDRSRNTTPGSEETRVYLTLWQ